MSLTPAVTKDGFSYAGDLFAEASGHNRHRRATVEELKKHVRSGSDKDFPAHWFEAQCMHYGIPPSKTKAVARMRLLDALNDKKLAVPAHLQKLETDLKKEWTKNESAAKKSLKKESGTSAPAGGKKRKHELTEETVTTTNTWTYTEVKTTTEAPSKKSKPTVASPRKPLYASPSHSGATISSSRPVQTARCSGRGGSSATGRGGSSATGRGTSSTARAGTTASTRGKGATARGKPSSTSGRDTQKKQGKSGKEETPPPPYTEYAGPSFMSSCHF